MQTNKPKEIKGVKYVEAEDYYEHASSKNKDFKYLVIPWDRSIDKWQCTCKDFMYRDKKQCKHIERVKFIDETGVLKSNGKG